MKSAGSSLSLNPIENVLCRTIVGRNFRRVDLIQLREMQ
jgi:hypothetical protein